MPKLIVLVSSEAEVDDDDLPTASLFETRETNHVSKLDAGQSRTLTRPAAPLAACVQRPPHTTTHAVR